MKEDFYGTDKKRSAGQSPAERLQYILKCKTGEISIEIWRLLEMTEKEKMLSGELYDPTDKELEQLRLNTRKLARKYNSTGRSAGRASTDITRITAKNRGDSVFAGTCLF